MALTFILTLIILIQVALFAGIVISLLMGIYETSIDASVTEMVPLDRGRLEERSAPDSYQSNQITVLGYY
jgi:hypothetical protein